MLKGKCLVLSCSEKKEYKGHEYYFVTVMLGERPLNISSKIDLQKWVRQEVVATFSVSQFAKEIKIRVESVGS